MHRALIVSLASLALLGSGASAARADDYPIPSGYPEPATEFEACPVAPEPIDPEGEPPPGGEEGEGEEAPPKPDPVLVELRAQRIDAAQVCRALAARLEEQLHRQWWTTAEINKQSPFVEGINEHLVNLDGSRCSPCEVIVNSGQVRVTGPEEGPVEVTGPGSGAVEVSGISAGEGGVSEEQIGHLVSAVDSSGEASKAGLWFIAAVLLLGMLAYPIYKAFIFWREHV